jgi:hypothetical protein
MANEAAGDTPNEEVGEKSVENERQYPKRLNCTNSKFKQGIDG